MQAIRKTFGIATIILSPILYVSACTYSNYSYEQDFDLVEIGEPKKAVLERFGTPSFRECSGRGFPEFTTEGTECHSPCVQRLWFVNRLMLLGIEAWSVSIGSDGRVVEKYHWVSP